MNRRSILKSIAGAGVTGLITAREEEAQGKVETAIRGLPRPNIRDIRVIETAPAGSRLDVIRITTDQDGLYGYGCATFTQRADLIKSAVERYLKPLLMDHEVDKIEDIWQACYDSSYWKNGPILNNAISGVDQALWEIKGRMANMPVYDLVGGKCRAITSRTCRWMPTDLLMRGRATSCRTDRPDTRYFILKGEPVG